MVSYAIYQNHTKGHKHAVYSLLYRLILILVVLRLQNSNSFMADLHNAAGLEDNSVFL